MLIHLRGKYFQVQIYQKDIVNLYFHVYNEKQEIIVHAIVQKTNLMYI